MPTQHDGRLLNNLINREKEATQAFKQYSLNSGSAAAALSTWSTTDSANTTDIMDASIQITQLLSSLTDTQRSYLNALTLYRSALKEVHGREIALKTVVRDREILVNRVIKLGNKKPKDEQLAVHQLKLEDAQRELTACETFLQEEEIALSELKRRSFREALAHRMKSMGELGRVMEDVAIEALDILAQLDGPDGAFNPDHYREDFAVGSDAGESIAPFDSASQAMSRASSSNSLNEEYQAQQSLQNAPSVPVSVHANGNSRQLNGHASNSHLRQSTTDSLASPPASRAPSHMGRAPASMRSSVQPEQPVMPPVPTAPRPISQVAYTERHAGMPTFEIPKAPDLSRRPDDSSDDEDNDRHEVTSNTHTDPLNSGVPAKLRSRSYPLDSPGLASPQRSGFMMGSIGGGGGGKQSSRRRAMSDSSSIEDRSPRQRKRSGSFFGGIASLFKRKDKKDRDEDDEEDTRYRDNSEADYYEGRNRLANGGGGGTSRSDANVMAAVLGAGIRQPNNHRSRAGADSSDDDEPRNVVKHVNDPKQRIRAMSDIGRASSTVGAASIRSNSGTLRQSSNPPVSSRPVLSRKNTSTSVASRPMSMTAGSVVRPKFVEKKYAADGSQLGESKKTKKVKKAASDIGYVGGQWTSTVPSSTAPAPAPVPSSEPAAPAPDTASITRKKKSKKVKEPAETVILSAEALGIPASGTNAAAAAPSAATSSPAFAPSRPAEVSRSNTITSNVSASVGPKIKKKKKTPSVAGSIAEERSLRPLPTADDLAKTLPTARSSSSAFTTQLPRPDDDPYKSGSTRPLSTVAPAAAAPSSPTIPPTTSSPPPLAKSVKSKLAADEKRNKRHSQLHGEGNWVSLPASAHPVGQSAPASRSQVREGDESLLAAVERAGMIDSAKPSRTYTGSKPNSGTTTPTPGSGTGTKAALSSSVSAPALRASTPTNQGLSPSASTGPAWVTGGAGAGVTKRKSVRLADGGNLSVPSPNPHHVPSSPASSVRSGSVPPAAPKPILMNSSPARSTSSQPAGGDWPTRASIRASMMDSSDEEDGDGGYMAARRALRKETKSMNEVFGNNGNKVDKGKGRA